MAKLTKDEWIAARAKWERSTRDGFEWLAKELGVARQTIQERAKREEWSRESRKKPAQAGKKPAEKPAGDNKESIEGVLVELATVTAGKYDHSFPDMAYRLCLIGYTNEQLATAFDICVATLTTWRKKYPELNEKIKAGKDIADSFVAESIYKSAVGGHILIEEKETIEGTFTTTRTVPPNANSQRYWMNNRQAKLWKENVIVKDEININVFPSAEVLDEISRKSLAIAAEKFKIIMGDRMARMGITLEDDDVIDG